MHTSKSKHTCLCLMMHTLVLGNKDSSTGRILLLAEEGARAGVHTILFVLEEMCMIPTDVVHDT